MSTENPEHLTIALVGAGNVATHLAPALGKNLVALVGRTPEKARALGERCGVKTSGELSELRRLRPDVIIISVSDKGIADLAATIGNLGYEPLVLHTSGTVGMEALEPISRRTGVLYPLQTFSAQAELDISKVPFFTEASRESDLEITDTIARSISPVVNHADAGRRRVLHIAGVFTSNFTNVLLESVETVLAPAGYSLDVVRPLLEVTVAKAFAMGPHDAQTGPARRGDFAVLDRQLAALPEHLKDSYTALSNLILHNHKISKPENE